MWSSMVAPGPLYFAGLVPWPPLPMDELPLTMRWNVMDVAVDIHHVLIIVLVAAIPLHVAAALKHHFWNRHDVLRGCCPRFLTRKTPGERSSISRESRDFPRAQASAAAKHDVSGVIDRTSDV